VNPSVLAVTSSNYPQTFARGERLQNRYVIVRLLGAGGMGAVYEAIDERLQVTVAIKETFAVDARLRRQFEQEARLLAQLSHPALPRVSDYFTEDERAFLVMQFIAGDDLAHAIAERSGPFPRAQVIAWADQLLDALIYLHTRERQIIHRDIKPHNLKITATGQIALLDFGLAKTHAGDQSTTNTSHSIFGYTRRYSPLEQIQDQGTSPQSDIYALGATLYHLLTGIKPPDALARAAALANANADPMNRPCELHLIVGSGLSAVLEKALAVNACDRFPNASEFREALRRVGRADLPMVQKADCSRASTQQSDPFDSYSILKPDELAWLRPARSRSIGMTVFGVAVLLALGLLAGSLAWPMDAPAPVTVDQVKMANQKNVNLPARESKNEKSRGVANVAASTSSNANGYTPEKQKRNGKHNNSNLADPPVPSLAPALRLPAQ
jgi:serine/threonine protein kinase